MANKTISSLANELTGPQVDGGADWIEIDDVSAAETKKVQPQSIVEGGGGLLAGGSVPMSGHLDMGTKNVINVGTVDGRDVSADGSLLDNHVANGANPHAVTLQQAIAQNRAHVLYYDDFTRLGAEWTQATVGTGQIKHLPASDADASSASGAAKLSAAAVAADAASIIHDTLWVDPSISPVFECRVKLAATIGNVGFELGLSDLAGGGASYALLTHAGGDWRAEAASSTGTGSDATTTAVALVADAWVVLRIEIDPGVDAKFYVGGTLITTLSTAAAIPAAGDELAPFFRVVYLAGADRMVPDWVEVRGER